MQPWCRTPAPALQPSEGHLGLGVGPPDEETLGRPGGKASGAADTQVWAQQPAVSREQASQRTGEERLPTQMLSSLWGSLPFTSASVCLQVNSDYNSTFVFDNDFPALQPDAPDPGERCSSCLTQLRIFKLQCCSADFHHLICFRILIVSIATTSKSISLNCSWLPFSWVH